MKLKGLIKKVGAVIMSAAMLCTGAAVLPQAIPLGIKTNAVSQSTVVIDGVTYNKDKTELIKCSQNKYGICRVEKGVKIIRSDAFSGCTLLTQIILPDSLKIIEERAFEHCSSLKSMNIPYGVKKVGDGCFWGCTELSVVVIPESVDDISYYSFSSEGELLPSAGLFDYEKENAIIISSKGSKSEKYATFHGGIDFFDLSVVKNDAGTFNSVKSKKGDYFFFFIAKKAGDYTFSYSSKQRVFVDDPSGRNIPLSYSSGNYNTSGSKNYRLEEGSLVSWYFEKDIHDINETLSSKDIKITVTAKEISLSKNQMSLGKGESVKLTATVSGLSNKSVSWRTSNSKILTVDKNGNVKAVNNGTAWITARTTNGLEKSCKITVKNAPSKVTLTKGILTIGVGEKYSVNSGVNNGAAAAKRTYRTSNSSIVKMTRTDWQGDFVGVKPGVAYVTIRTYNGKESTCKVTVKAAPTSVTISKKTLTMKVGQTATLSCSVPSNAGCATRTFRSSNNNIVKMTKTNWTGSFKAMKPGTAYVTVRTYNGKESTCKITVK